MKQLCLLLPGLFSCALYAQQPVFTKVTDPANPVVTFVNTPAAYKGVAWIDIDHDDRPDVFMNQRFLFHNDGAGQFTQLPNLTVGSGVSGSSWGDIDNDGDPDCIISSASSGMHLNNDGSTFTVATGMVPGLTGVPMWDCTLADADNNGLLDLLFVHAAGFFTTDTLPCRFYLQTSPGVFELQTGYEFTDLEKAYTIASWTDYDLDGDLDLFIGSGPVLMAAHDYCYKNLLIETGSFELQRLTAPPFDGLEDGQVYNFIDYDNDGDMDGMLTNYASATTRFWKNNNDTLTLVPAPFSLVAIGHLANVWGDVDNDGYLDVLISTDATREVELYRNDRNGGFLPVEIAGRTDTLTGACGVALADYDNDGDLDFATNGTLNSRGLFRNDTLTNGRHWIAFTLTGSSSNRSAIGAKVRVKSVLNGQPVWQIREILAHNSFQSQNDLRQHFGLDDASEIDSVEIRWPSGLIQQFDARLADRFYSITEGEQLEQVSAVSAPNREIPLIKIAPNPTSGIFQLYVDESQAPIRKIEVVDNQGKVVGAKVTHTNSNDYEVQLPKSVPAGIYWIQIRFESGQSRSEMLIKY